MKKLIAKKPLVALWIGLILNVSNINANSSIVDYEYLLQQNDIENINLSSVTELNLNSVNEVSKILQSLSKNKTLNSLQKIDLTNSDLSNIKDLEVLRDLKPDNGFKRPMETVSGRFGYRVIVLHVSINNTPLAKDLTKRWELNNVLSKPVEERSTVFYEATQEYDAAHLQIIALL